MVSQLQFTRNEFWRGLDGLSEEEAVKRVGPSNSISWNVGHLAWQEQRYWIWRLQDADPIEPRLNEEFCFGCPGTTPPLAAMRRLWDRIVAYTASALDQLTTEDLERERQQGDVTFNAGNLMNRMIYHYWYHLGESLGIRQALGHTGLPDFVGDVETAAPFRRF